MINYKKYKEAKRYVKKVTQDAKFKAYNDLYKSLATKNGQKEIFDLLMPIL